MTEAPHMMLPLGGSETVLNFQEMASLKLIG